MNDQPETVWEDGTELGSGSRTMVRAAAFPLGSTVHGGVTLSCVVPEGFFAPVAGGGASATTLMGAGEARQLAKMLSDAADAAEQQGPPIYGD
jgi:hypothetical protein